MIRRRTRAICQHGLKRCASKLTVRVYRAEGLRAGPSEREILFVDAGRAVPTAITLSAQSRPVRAPVPPRLFRAPTPSAGGGRRNASRSTASGACQPRWSEILTAHRPDRRMRRKRRPELRQPRSEQWRPLAKRTICCRIYSNVVSILCRSYRPPAWRIATSARAKRSTTKRDRPPV